MYSKCGWDHVVEGVVMLGFYLMDSCAPKTSSEPVNVTLQYPNSHMLCCRSSIQFSSVQDLLSGHKDPLSLFQGQTD